MCGNEFYTIVVIDEIVGRWVEVAIIIFIIK
jgi:hypothetical protein